MVMIMIMIIIFIMNYSYTKHFHQFENKIFFIKNKVSLLYYHYIPRILQHLRLNMKTSTFPLQIS